MKTIFLFTLIIWGTSSVSSQTIDIETVFDENNDGLLDKAKNLYFSEKGDYFYLMELDSQIYYITNSEVTQLGQREEVSSSYSSDSNGEVITHYFSQDSCYYKNPKSIEYYKAGKGKIIKQITNFYHHNIAITTEKNDSIFHFLNGELLAQNSKENTNLAPEIEKWCSFSRNGNALYYLKKGDKYFLYKNSQIIDSTTTRFIGLQINNQGDYFYGIGKNGTPKAKFDYMFFPVHNSLMFDSVRTIWDSYLNEDGGFYCSGGNPSYILINGKYFEHAVPKNIILPNNNVFFYANNLDGEFNYNTAVQRKKIGDKKIINPSMDGRGDFAFFLKSKRKYQVVVNGEIKDEKVIGNPISIDSHGNFITYRVSPRFSKVYRNNELIIRERGKIKVYNREAFFELYLYNFSVKNIPVFDKSFYYFEIGDKGYFVWDGVISNPIKKASRKVLGDEHYKSGELLAGGINDDGFYIIQYNSKLKTTVILNNHFIETNEEIDSIIDDSIFFGKNKIVFYAICGKEVKRFKISE